MRVADLYWFIARNMDKLDVDAEVFVKACEYHLSEYGGIRGTMKLDIDSDGDLVVIHK